MKFQARIVVFVSDNPKPEMPINTADSENDREPDL